LVPHIGGRDGWFARAAATARALRDPTPEICANALAQARKLLETKGRADVSTLTFLFGLGLQDEAFDLIAQSDYGHLWVEDGLGHDMAGVIPGIIFGVANQSMRRDPRFVGLCAKLGLCAYWAATDNWPDCALENSSIYDFRQAVLATVG
jgi:hypothetical protein